MADARSAALRAQVIADLEATEQQLERLGITGDGAYRCLIEANGSVDGS